ncbi:Protein of unknown function [Bacillus mycoides]|nr:Protein of unknown function [Bacillus mycoides]
MSGYLFWVLAMTGNKNMLKNRKLAKAISEVFWSQF